MGRIHIWFSSTVTRGVYLDHDDNIDRDICFSSMPERPVKEAWDMTKYLIDHEGDLDALGPPDYQPLGAVALFLAIRDFAHWRRPALNDPRYSDVTYLPQEAHCLASFRQGWADLREHLFPHRDRPYYDLLGVAFTYLHDELGIPIGPPQTGTAADGQAE